MKMKLLSISAALVTYLYGFHGAMASRTLDPNIPVFKNESQYSDVPANVTEIQHLRCDTFYKFFFTSFEIRGANWLEVAEEWQADYLRRSIHERCGLVTKWRFNTYSIHEDPPWQWIATGRVPVGAVDCMSSILQQFIGVADMDHACDLGQPYQ